MSPSSPHCSGHDTGLRNITKWDIRDCHSTRPSIHGLYSPWNGLIGFSVFCLAVIVGTPPDSPIVKLISLVAPSVVT